MSKVKSLRQQRLKQIAALAGSLLMVAIVWLVVLPSIAARPAMRDRLQWLDQRGIDPSAMYYTELEVMQEILQRQRQRQRDRRRGK